MAGPHVSATKVRARSALLTECAPHPTEPFYATGKPMRPSKETVAPPAAFPVLSSPPHSKNHSAPRRASPPSAAMDIAPGEEPPAGPSGEHPPPSLPLPGRDVIPPWRVLCYAYAGGVGSGLARDRRGFRVGINRAGAAFAFALLGRGVGLGGLGFMAVRDFVRVGRGIAYLHFGWGRFCSKSGQQKSVGFERDLISFFT